MTNFPFNKCKAIAAVLFVIQQLGGKVSKHKLAKILYFADRKHLAQYMRSIFGDDYRAMKYSPVPSKVYDGVQGDFSDVLEVRGKNIFSSTLPDLDVLSQSDVDCLLSSIRENKDLTFDEFVDKSHQDAYHKAKGGIISVLDMAREEGANDDTIAYIKDVMSDYQIVSSL